MARILLRRDGRRTPSAASAPTSGRHRVAAGRTALFRRLAPLGAGVVVLGLLGLIAAVLPRPANEVPVVRGSQVIAEPPPVVAPDGPLVLPLPAPPVLSSAPPAPAVPVPSPTTRKAAPRTSADGPAAAAPARPGTFGVRPISRACRGDAGAPKPGDVICFSGALGSPLEITAGGTPGQPIVYSGDGTTRVPGIRAEADNVVIQGFVSDGADSTGIWTSGRNVTIQDNTITRVRYTGEDLDAMRFFGDGTRILFNSVRNLEGNNPQDAHVDCIQNFATSRPGSSDVRIQGNRCEGIRAQCLMAEGPNAAEGGGGVGVSRNWLFDGNYCDAYAEAQSIALEDVQDVTISNNQMVGRANKAISLRQNATGTTVRGNKIGSGYRREVEFDDPSARSGYQGPPAT